MKLNLINPTTGQRSILEKRNDIFIISYLIRGTDKAKHKVFKTGRATRRYMERKGLLVYQNKENLDIAKR